MMFEYINFRRQTYEGGAVFIPVCPICGRFVKADDSIRINMLDEISEDPNGTCAKCGRINMPFEGWYEE